MRELTNDEIEQIGGGLGGTPIPFSPNGFISTPNWPGGWFQAAQGVYYAGVGGFAVGTAINHGITSHYGMSPGQAAFQTFGGGSDKGL